MRQHYNYDLMALLHDVARLTRVEADRRARVDGMTRAQWGILLKLARQPGLSQKELADLLEVEPISVARLVDRLEAAGLVERRADEQDRRIWRLHLRAQATGMLTRIDRQREILESSIVAGMAAPMREHMLAGLHLMKQNLLRISQSEAPQAEPAQDFLPAEPAQGFVQAEPAPTDPQATPARPFQESA